MEQYILGGIEIFNFVFKQLIILSPYGAFQGWWNK